MVRDRLDRSEFPMTQDFLSLMLGTRRPSVTDVARDLQRRNLIDYDRGYLRLLDPDGLEGSSCECYGIIRTMYAGAKILYDH